MDIVSSPKVGHSLPKPPCLLWEAYTQTCPKWDKIFTMACWCRSMIACQVAWISDEFWIYYNSNTRHLNVLSAINSALVFEIHSHLLHGTKKFTQGHTCDFSTYSSALEHVLVAQIWIMHIECPETQLMHKNVQTNPKKSQKFTQHSCWPMLTW